MNAPFVKLPNGELVRSDLIISVRIEDEKVLMCNGEQVSRDKCHLILDYAPPITVPKSTYLYFESIEERDRAREMVEAAMIEAGLLMLTGRGAS